MGEKMKSYLRMGNIEVITTCQTFVNILRNKNLRKSYLGDLVSLCCIG